jgi:hypothetical protein
MISKFEYLPFEEFNTLPQGIEAVARAIYKNSGIKCKYVIRLDSKTYAPVASEMFYLFLIEGSIFRKTSIEVIVPNNAILQMFKVKREK